MWPLEAIPYWFVWISYALPTTWAAEAMRSIMIRDWSLTHSNVWVAFLVCIGWTTVFISVAAIFLTDADRQWRWWKRLRSYIPCLKQEQTII